MIRQKFRPIIRKEDILIPDGSYVSNIEPPTINNEFKSIVDQSDSDADNYDYQQEINSDDDSVISSPIHKTQDLIEFHLQERTLLEVKVIKQKLPLKYKRLTNHLFQALKLRSVF